MEQQTYFVTFENASAAEANRYAEELRHLILEASPDITVQRQRDDPRSQDFGATLVLLLGTPAAGALIKALGDWLALRNRASLTIRRADEAIVLQNITSAKATELAQLQLTREKLASIEAPAALAVQAPSPQTTLLILLGASAWPLFPEFQSSEAFAHAATHVKNYFLNPWLFGLPAENLLDLFDVDESSDKLDIAIGAFLEQRLSALRTAGHPGRDVLLYFIGHGGFVGSDSDFYVAIRRTRMDNPRVSGMQMMALADTLTQRARQLRRILILDCCFAGAAFSAFQAGPAQVALQKTSDAFEVKRKAVGFPTKGTALLCSSSHTSPSLLLPDGSSTMFTRAILDALVQETPAWRDHLSLRDVKDLAADVLSGIRDAPRPVVLSPDQSEGDVADLPFFPNPGFEEQRRRPEEGERHHRVEEEQANLSEAEQSGRANKEDRRQAEERPVREAGPVKESPHVSASPPTPTVAAAVLPERGGRRYLFALLVGALVGLLSVLLTNVIYRVHPTVNVYHDVHVSFALLPPLMLSLITGFLAGKRVVVPTAALVAGLLVGIFWLVYALSMLVGHDFPPPVQYGGEEWVAVVACAPACGLLSWLGAWMRTHLHLYERGSGS